MLTKKETEAVVSAFMAALMTGSYGDISLRAVAEPAKVPLTKLVMHGATRADLLAAFADRIDAIVVDGDDPGMMEEPPRERLFDVMMRRTSWRSSSWKGMPAAIRPWRWIWFG